MKLSKLNAAIEGLFPPIWAEDWDYSGLIAGDPWADIERIMLALDPLPEVIKEAAEKGIHLLITHHPPDLNPPRRLVRGDSVGGAVYDCISKGIALYSLHTPLDVSEVSPSFAMARLLDMENTAVLEPTDGGNLLKLTVYVPVDHLDCVSEAIYSAGAGHIGKYSHCSFRVEGEGTFKPGEGTNPFSGRRGEISREKESRLETILPREKLPAVLKAMLREHPYEEVAYDIYPLENAPGRIGYGAVGNLRIPMTLLQLAQQLKGITPASGIAVCGPDSARISKVAVVGGSGGDFIDIAKSVKADVLITGEAGYHKLRKAQNLALPVILLGHFASEWIGLPLLKSYLEKRLWDRPGEGTIDIAQAEHGPVWMT
ncbi:MAG TPA: Nif3-like dinuclear metal center hexameric protein [candidate division Zixibacteria bacterium]|nr:Nif3-like dinuclear metal center hexameric protein [candidate division Zixibacteria bacterium]